VGGGKIACNQVLYHVQERAIEHGVISWCEAHAVTVVAYSPFGQGNFPSATSKGGKVLAEIAGKRAATPRQVALAFLLRREGVLAIPKAASRAHLEENAAAAEVVLTAEEIRRIDEAFPLGKPRSLPML
jgi:diketogulonate reductase-like aldo/keto reductase